MKNKYKIALIVIIIASTPLYGLAQTSPLFWTHSSRNEKGYSYTTQDNVTIFDYLTVGNNDPTRSVVLSLKGTIEEKEGWIAFAQNQITVLPNTTQNVNFTILIPEEVCSGTYNGRITAYLTDYDNSPNNNGVAVRLGNAQKIEFNITSAKICDPPEELPNLNEPATFLGANAFLHVAIIPNDDIRIVFFDKNGDGIYQIANGDYAITEGFVNIYDNNNNSVKTTDLSQTAGRYEVPNDTIENSQNFYATIITDEINNGTANINKKGNIFVDRLGTAEALSNSFQINNISNYSSITQNIDIRSRNTDQNGVWESGTLSIGPDDKDQIISPLHWDQLVQNTDFQYVDLDHDGRVDPDDKDHVISPLYWDFPN